MEFTLEGMWAESGFIARFVIVALGVMSIYVLYVLADRLFVYRAAIAQSRMFAERTGPLLQEARFAEALASSQEFKKSHVARVVAGALVEYNDASGDKSAGIDAIAAVKRSIEKNSARVMADLRKGLSGLATVGSTAPFVGLFGTVFGIINSFMAMPQGGGSLEVVGPGIAEALITTGAGIGVAVIGVLLYNFFTNWAEKLQGDVAESALECVDTLIKHHESAKAKA